MELGYSELKRGEGRFSRLRCSELSKRSTSSVRHICSMRLSTRYEYLGRVTVNADRSRPEAQLRIHSDQCQTCNSIITEADVLDSQFRGVGAAEDDSCRARWHSLKATKDCPVFLC